MCQVCAVCLCKTYCRQISTSLHLSAVLDCALKASWWLWVCFLTGVWVGSYLFDLAGKNMGSTTESHLLCQLFFRAAIFSWERISAARITDRSVRAGSYLDMKDGKMEEGRCKSEGEERRRERGRDPLGIIIPEIHWSRVWVGGRRLLNLAHHHFISRYFTCPPFFCRPGCKLTSAAFPLFPLRLSRLDGYIVYASATTRVTACLGILLLVWSLSFLFVCGHHARCCRLTASLVHVRSADLLLLFCCRWGGPNKTVVLQSDILRGTT